MSMSYQGSTYVGKDKIGYYTDGEEDLLQSSSSSSSSSFSNDAVGTAIEVASCHESCAACRQDYCGTLPATIESSLRNRYLFSNVVYCVYAMLIVYIDQKAYPDANALYAGDDDYYADNTAYTNALEGVNNLFVASGILHLINSLMYIWAWLPLGFNLCSVVMIPEYLNVIGASIYLYTATLYSKTDGSYQDEVTFTIHHYETAAASIEIIAALGWCCTWWLTYPRGQPGRGWTLDDPDTWANVFIVVPSILYVVYNAQILADPLSYCCNTLYTQGDTLYAIGSVFYLLAALRDDGYFGCMPAGGTCKYGLDPVTILDPMGTQNNYPSQQQLKQAVGTGHVPKRYICGMPPPSRWPCFSKTTESDIGATLSFRERFAKFFGRQRNETQSLLK